MRTLHVDVEGTAREVPAGTAVETLAPARVTGALPYLAALVNNDVASLSYPLSINCAVRFLTAADPHGWRVYRQSLCFLLAKAIHELYPAARFSVEHSLGPGLFCSFHGDPDTAAGISPAELARIEERMRALVAADLPVERRKVSYADAVREFETAGQQDKRDLLRFRNPPHVVTHWCDGFADLAHAPVAPRTGALGRFHLVHYPPGFVLQHPRAEEPGVVPPFRDQPNLFHIFQEHKEWGRILGLRNVGKLNEVIAQGRIEDFIRTAEALHEKKLARIADAIAAARDRIKLILIAGPSSSGKTTFAKRLSVHLAVNGLRPVALGTDDYFVGDERNPKGEDGKPDYEHLEAVDLDLLNRNLLDLIEGREVDPPRFNFTTKQREFRGAKPRIAGDQTIIIEGIHALNPRLTNLVPDARKFRIYVSALTQLNVDANNRISTTDNRLMRRIVRDFKFRAHTALQTLRLWPMVRRGEERWIFPYQQEADTMFNTALDYELAVLKPLVEPLLMEVKPFHPEYAEARRLSEFLLNFLPAPDRPIPNTSILREYIGGSGFRY